MWFALWLACAKQSNIETTESMILMETEQAFWKEHPKWSGEVSLPKDQVLGHTVHFTVVDGKLNATMDIPMQNAMGLPLCSCGRQFIEFYLETTKGSKVCLGSLSV